MRAKEIYQRIERILDEWDPIGILQGVKPIKYSEGAIGEYSIYIEPIISVFLSKKSMYDYLVELYTELRDYPSEKIKKEIKFVASQITVVLSQSDLDDIQAEPW